MEGNLVGRIMGMWHKVFSHSLAIELPFQRWAWKREQKGNGMRKRRERACHVAFEKELSLSQIFTFLNSQLHSLFYVLRSFPAQFWRVNLSLSPTLSLPPIETEQLKNRCCSSSSFSSLICFSHSPCLLSHPQSVCVILSCRKGGHCHKLLHT